MFCLDPGIFPECCYYWRRVPSGAARPLPRSALGLAFQLIFSRTRIPRLWCGGLMVSSGIHSLVCAMRTTLSPSLDYFVVFYYYYIYFFIAALRLHGCAGFSLVVASGATLRCSVWVSNGSHLSCAVWAPGLEGVSSWSTWARSLWLPGCRAQTQ